MIRGERPEANRLQTVAFAAKCNYARDLCCRSALRFGHSRWGTVSGTVGAFCIQNAQEAEQKRRKAAVSLTAASPNIGAELATRGLWAGHTTQRRGWRAQGHESGNLDCGSRAQAVDQSVYCYRQV